MKKTKIFLVIIFMASNLFGIKDVNYNVLKKENKIIQLESLPDTDYSKNIISLIEDFDPEICVEGIFYVDKEYKLTRKELITNVMAVSTLTGIEYYSQREKKYKVFVKEAYIADEKGKPIADPSNINLNSLPSVRAIVMDNRFGKLHYNIDYFNSGQTFGMVMTNLTTLSYMYVPLVAKENVRLMYQIIPTEDGFIFYGLSMTKTKVPGFLEERLSGALYNRMVAVINWYIGSVD